MSKLTITLTNRPPVRIDKDAWPVLASAHYEDYEGQYKFQSFRTLELDIRVRQSVLHADDRVIVYAVGDYDTASQNERSWTVKDGVLLRQGADSTAIIEAIHEVCSAIEDRPEYCETQYGGEWRELAREVIGDLPAEDLD